MFNKKTECQHEWQPLIQKEKQIRYREKDEVFNNSQVHIIYETEKTITWFYCKKCLISKKL